MFVAITLFECQINELADRSNSTKPKIGCNYKGCKVCFNSKELLAEHSASEHNCSHLGCTATCKNQVALKEHQRDKHGTHCEANYMGKWWVNLSWRILLLNAKQGKLTHQITTWRPTSLIVHIALTPRLWSTWFRSIAKIMSLSKRVNELLVITTLIAMTDLSLDNMVTWQMMLI